MPGPVGIAGALLAGALGLPLIGSYHTELTAYAKLRSESQSIADVVGMAVGAFYNACDLVLSPSPASDEALTSIGMAPEKVCLGSGCGRLRASIRRYGTNRWRRAGRGHER